MNIRNIFYTIFTRLKYVVVTKLVPFIQDQLSNVKRALSTPLALHILGIIILAKMSKLLPDQILPIADVYLGIFNNYYLLSALFVSSAFLIFRRHIQAFSGVQPIRRKVSYAIFASSLETIVLLLMLVSSLMSFLTDAFPVPMQTSLMVIGYASFLWLLKWLIKNRFVPSGGYSI